MKSKNETLYICTKCDAQSLKWNGRCAECGGWGTLKAGEGSLTGKSTGEAGASELILLRNIKTKDHLRLKTGINEFDQVVGGGIVPGSLISRLRSYRFGIHSLDRVNNY